MALERGAGARQLRVLMRELQEVADDGAACGVVAWLFLGRWLTEEVRKAATGAAPASRFLVAYVFLLGFIQALPLDLNSSPADA